MNTDSDTPSPLTVYAMAQRLGRSQIAIHNYLSRHGIKPIRVENRRRLYPADTLQALATGMRARHGRSQKPSNQAA